MDRTQSGTIELLDLHPEVGDLRREVLDGLSRTQKELPAKLFYDERGSALYEEITRLDEYYLTRTEKSIMRANIEEMSALLGPRVLLIEYGSGNSEKTRILLDALDDLAAYVPVDISKEHLVQAAEALAEGYPGLEILPVCADYTTHIDLPELDKEIERRVVFFPGSTIGNFTPTQAEKFLSRVAEYCVAGDVLLLGADLKKDRETLKAAYDDRAGVTAEFNLNVLQRLNRELGTGFDPAGFGHRAIYNEEHGRIEMHLVSLRDQVVRLDDRSIAFERGETIWTESSYKYTSEEIASLGASAGFELERVWSDPARLFSVNYLVLKR